MCMRHARDGTTNAAASVADSPSFLLAFVLTQPSFRAVIGSDVKSKVHLHLGVSGRDPHEDRPLVGHVAQAMNIERDWTAR